MQFQKVEAGAGVAWWQAGWNLFMRNPGALVIIALVFGVIYIVAAFIPVIGSLATLIFGPAMFGGLLYALAKLDRGETPEVGDLFAAFKIPGKLTPMLLLCLPAVALGVIAVVLAFLFIGSMLGAVGMSGGSEAAAVGMATGGLGLFMLIMFALGLAYAALMFFAVPAVMLGGAEPFSAMKDSLSASLGNIVAMILFMLLYIVAAIVAMIPLGLGFLVLLPVMAGAMYVAWQQVFPGQGGNAQIPPPPTV